MEWSHGVEWFFGVVFLEWFFGVEFWSGFLESNFGVSFADFSLDNQTESTNRHTDWQAGRQTDRQPYRQTDSHNNTQRCRLVLTDR